MIYLKALEPTFFDHIEPLSDDDNHSSLLYSPLKHFEKPSFGAYANIVTSSLTQEKINILKYRKPHSVLSTQEKESPSVSLANVEEDVQQIDNKHNFVKEESESKESISEEYIETFVLNPSTLDTPNKKHKKRKKKEKSKKEYAYKYKLSHPFSDDEDYLSWLFNLKPIHGSNTEKLLKKSKKKKKKKIDIEIEKSIQMGEDIVSESLADLYEKQGHIELAIDMFHKLNLKYPDKSSYFALKILELKSKLSK